MSFDWRFVKAVFFLPFTAAIGAVIGPMISLPVVGYEMLNDIEPETYSGPAWYVGLVLGIPFFAWLGWKTIYREMPVDERLSIFGTARWANARERKALTDPVDGLLLGRTTDKGQALLRYDGVAHLLTLAPTRSGKGVGTIIPNLDPVERAMGLMAGYGLQLWLILQDIHQLRALYGEKAGTFFANAGVIQTFGVNDYETAEWLSKTMGQETVEYATESRGRTHSGFIDGSTSQGVSQQFTGRSLLNPDEVMRIGESQQILLVKAMPPVSADKLRYFADREFTGLYDAP